MVTTSTSHNALTGATIFDGHRLYKNHALLITNDRVSAICERSAIPADSEIVTLNGGTLIPGLIDLQVNGGGGVLLNNNPTVQGIASICMAHAQLGTTSLLPTLITASATVTEQAILAAIEAQRRKVPGFLGIHLEGPHLSVEKKGAHNADLIRPMSDSDLELYTSAREQLNCLMMTVAPESVTDQQIETLAKAGITVSLGHSNASYEQCMSAFNAGATCATHLYNAMSPLTHREPGLVGAALSHNKNSCGLIADGHHVHPAAIKHALKAKHRENPIFLISDAMSLIGTTIDSFKLDGRQVFRKGGRLELSDGTLAGADISLLDAVKFIVDSCDVEPEEAIRMATVFPANCIGSVQTNGTLEPGQQANVVHLNDDYEVLQVWRDGKPPELQSG